MICPGNPKFKYKRFYNSKMGNWAEEAQWDSFKIFKSYRKNGLSIIS
jgi:hypothetical protein